MADAEELFSKPYSYPKGRDANGTYQQEGDDGDDEMTHGNDKNDVSENMDDVSSYDALTVSDKLSELDEVVVEKQVADIESIDDVMTSSDDDVRAGGQSDDETKKSKSVMQNDVKAKDQKSDGLNDQLDDATKRRVNDYIRKLLQEALQNKK